MIDEEISLQLSDAADSEERVQIETASGECYVGVVEEVFLGYDKPARFILRTGQRGRPRVLNPDTIRGVYYGGFATH